jgi:hypothetical protein
LCFAGLRDDFTYKCKAEEFETTYAGLTVTLGAKNGVIDFLGLKGAASGSWMRDATSMLGALGIDLTQQTPKQCQYGRSCLRWEQCPGRGGFVKNDRTFSVDYVLWDDDRVMLTVQDWSAIGDRFPLH